MTLQATVLGYLCNVRFQTYQNGQTAIQLITQEGEPYTSATSAISGVELEPDEVLIKDYSFNEGVLAALNKAGIVYNPHGVVELPFNHLHRCRLTPDAVKALQAQRDEDALPKPAGPLAGYRVHIYATVRVPIDVSAQQASNHKEAMEHALKEASLDDLLETPDYSYADDYTAFLVDDLDGRETVLAATSYGPDMEPDENLNAEQLNAKLTELKKFVSMIARMTIDGEKLNDDGTITRDEDAFVESDDAHATFTSLVQQARDLMK